MNSQSNTFRTLHDEFVLIGPVGERDKILARSDSAGMDLIGYAMDKDDSDEEKSETRLFDLFLGQNRSLHRVSSWPVQNAEPDEDERKSSYRFAWVGKCSSRDLRAIEKSFNANVFDISRAITYEDSEQLELSLAPMLLRCSRADDKFRRRLRLIRLFTVAYIMIFLAAAASMLVEPYLGRLLYGN
jgi:hypothetical protein